MRELVAQELLSLDGIVEAPEEWAFSYSNEAMEEMNEAGMGASDALLLGRVTYEEFAAHWPNQSDDDPMVEYLNSVSKYVVSTTLDEVEWNNSTLISDNVIEKIIELKQQSGEKITIAGSPTLVRSLLHEGLLDELQILIHPVVLGNGKRLFEDESEGLTLELVDTLTFETGVVSLTYRPESVNE